MSKQRKVMMNHAALKHKLESGYSHFVGGWELLVKLVENNFDRATPTDNTDSITVPVPSANFFCGLVKMHDRIALSAAWIKPEWLIQPYIYVYAVNGNKMPAAIVDVILQSHEKLGVDRKSVAYG